MVDASLAFGAGFRRLLQWMAGPSTAPIAIVTTLDLQPNPTDQTLHYMIKGYNMAQYKITLLK
jgi:hypothetical protein